MDEGDLQSTNSQQSLIDPRLAHQKVLQPDASFVAEVKAAQQATSDQVQPMPQGASQAQTQTPALNNQPPRPVVPASSIYPDATKDIGVPSNKPSFDFPGDESEAAAVKQPSKAKVLAVRAVAAIMLLINAYNAYNWWMYYRYNMSFTNLMYIVSAGIGLVLAVGIFRLSEVARSVYVLLSAIMLVLSCIGLLLFYSNYLTASSTSSFRSNTRQLTKSEIERSIQAAQNNQSFTPTQRRAIIHTLQSALNNAPSSPNALNIRQYISTGLLIVTSVFPLIFFTRPAIKQAFK